MDDNKSLCESISIDLPDQSGELLKAEEAIDKLKNRLKIIGNQHSITDEIHTKTFDEVVYVLDYVGKLSQVAFDVEDDLQEMYFKTYVHAPELAKTLWQEHYGKIHRPYNLLKNRCYKMLEELDAQYHKKFKKHPPNWKI